MRKHLFLALYHLQISSEQLQTGMLRSSWLHILRHNQPFPWRRFFIWHMGYDSIRYFGRTFTAESLTFAALEIHQPSIAQQRTRRWQGVLYYVYDFSDDRRCNLNFRCGIGRGAGGTARSATAAFFRRQGNILRARSGQPKLGFG